MTDTSWTTVITDENRRNAYYDYEPARAAATFADDGFIVTIARDSALPHDDGGTFTPQTNWAEVDVVHEQECPLIDDVHEALSLKACFDRAQIMAAALKVVDETVREDLRQAPCRTEGR